MISSSSSMDAIPNQYFTEVMAIAEFCNEFAKPIKLATFTVDMFYKALIHGKHRYRFSLTLRF